MDAAKAELLRALGKVVRGLSTLFWWLPVTLFLFIETARAGAPGLLAGTAFLPAMLAAAVLYYGLRQLHDFQKQERIWQQSLNRAELLAVINIGLAPFLFWWQRFPSLSFFTVSVSILGLSVLLFLMQLNHVLRRLCAMLPDEALRGETDMFTTLNITLFLIVFIEMAVYLALAYTHTLPAMVARMAAGDNPRGLWLALFLGILPLALTLAILWKIKEVIFQSICAAEK